MTEFTELPADHPLKFEMPACLKHFFKGHRWWCRGCDRVTEDEMRGVTHALWELQGCDDSMTTHEGPREENERLRQFVNYCTNPTWAHDADPPESHDYKQAIIAIKMLARVHSQLPESD